MLPSFVCSQKETRLSQVPDWLCSMSNSSGLIWKGENSEIGHTAWKELVFSQTMSYIGAAATNISIKTTGGSSLSPLKINREGLSSVTPFCFSCSGQHHNRAYFFPVECYWDSDLSAPAVEGYFHRIPLTFRPMNHYGFSPWTSLINSHDDLNLNRGFNLTAFKSSSCLLYLLKGHMSVFHFYKVRCCTQYLLVEGLDIANVTHTLYISRLLLFLILWFYCKWSEFDYILV